MAQVVFVALRTVACGNQIYQPGQEGQDGEDAVRELARRGFVRIVAGRTPRGAPAVAAVDLGPGGLVSRVLSPPGGAVTPEDKLPAPITPEDGLLAEWRLTGLKSSPAVYLRRTPDGPRSALARRLVEAGLGAG